MTEFALISFSILMIIQQLCRVPAIIQTKYCPLFEKEWTEKREEIKCKNGEEYFCSLAEDNTFISGCLPPYPIPANSTGCPFVVKSNNLIPHEDKFTPCNQNLKGCPPCVHPEYRVSHLYKYPLCLKLPSERMKSIIGRVEYETGLSTNVTPSVYDGDEREIHINAVIAITSVLVIVVIVLAVARFVIWYIERTEKAFARSLRNISPGLNVNGNVQNNESVQMKISGCRRHKGVTGEDPNTAIDVENTAFSPMLSHQKYNGMNEDIFKQNDSDKPTKVPEPRTETIENGLNGLISKENNNNEGDEGITLLMSTTKTTESSFFDLCRRNAEDAAAENLKGDLKEEYENIKGGCKSRITAEEIREIICIWEKKHGKLPFRTIVDKLLSLLNQNICL